VRQKKWSNCTANQQEGLPWTKKHQAIIYLRSKLKPLQVNYTAMGRGTMGRKRRYEAFLQKSGRFFAGRGVRQLLRRRDFERG